MTEVVAGVFKTMFNPHNVPIVDLAILFLD